jgi:GNAT superfamily N-acetyltransferase
MASDLKPLNESILRRLTNEALYCLLGQAAGFEADGRPGLQLVLCNEPVADLNMLVVGAGADPGQFREMASKCLDRELPFLVMIFPEAGDALDHIASELGLVYAVDFPIMVRDDVPIEPDGHPDVEVTRATGAAGAEANADVVASAYSMPKESALRAMPASLANGPSADVYIARLEGEAVSSVTLTHHGDTTGIWAMGTSAQLQRGGIGRRLLSTALAQARDSGARRFFLGATPAGYRLYEKLGFQDVCAARVWVSGETHQA